MNIHREGYPTLLATLFVLAIINYASIQHFFAANETGQSVVMAVSLVFFLFILQFFRNPNVRVEQNPNVVLAPADGKIVVIEETTEDELLKDRRIQVSIFMSPINVHVNRNPVSGVVKYVKYHAGKYLVAWHPKSSTENERTTIVIQTDKGVLILFRQIAGALARRIKWYVVENQVVTQGQEFGFIKFGSRVDVFLPLNAEVKVTMGQVSKGGQTVLAVLPPK